GGDAQRGAARARSRRLGRDARGRGTVYARRRPPWHLRGEIVMPTTLRTETADGVRSLVLCRPAEYNTITPTLRDDLAAAIDEADADPAVHVILDRKSTRLNSSHD